MGCLGEECSRQREPHMQRPWGRTVPGMLEQQRGGLCGWSRVSEGERGRRGGQGGDRAGRGGPCGLWGELPCPQKQRILRLREARNLSKVTRQQRGRT